MTTPQHRPLLSLSLGDNHSREGEEEGRTCPECLRNTITRTYRLCVVTTSTSSHGGVRTNERMYQDDYFDGDSAYGGDDHDLESYVDRMDI